MKKLKLKKLELTRGEILKREQLSNIFGGYYNGGDGTCTATLTCNTGSISCTSSTGDCKRGWGEICCDGICYEC